MPPFAKIFHLNFAELKIFIRHLMRKIWLLCWITALSTVGFAQGPPTGGGGGARRGGGQIPAIGHFYGKVVDAKSNKGMDGASVQLIQSKYDPVTHAQKDTIL